MPMTQQDIRTHYETEWQSTSESAPDTAELRYSNEIEDAVLYPAYKQLVADLKLKIDGGRVLDVGSGSGRWIRWRASCSRAAGGFAPWRGPAVIAAISKVWIWNWSRATCLMRLPLSAPSTAARA